MPTAHAFELHIRCKNNFLENDSFNSICANIKYDKTAWRHRNLKWMCIIGDTEKVINEHTGLLKMIVEGFNNLSYTINLR